MCPVGSRSIDPCANRGRGRSVDAAPPEQLKTRVEADPPERDDDTDAGKGVELGVEVGQAGGDFLRRRLVVGRRTPDRGCDERVAELQAVAGVVGGGEIRESGAMKRGHQEIA